MDGIVNALEIINSYDSISSLIQFTKKWYFFRKLKIFEKKKLPIYGLHRVQFWSTLDISGGFIFLYDHNFKRLISKVGQNWIRMHDLATLKTFFDPFFFAISWSKSLIIRLNLLLIHFWFGFVQFLMFQIADGKNLLSSKVDRNYFLS